MSMTRSAVRTARRPLDAEIPAVPSKSVTHRALIAAALARGASTIRDPLVAEDTSATLTALRALGLRAEAGAGAWTVEGGGGAIRGGARLDLRDSGTSMRFLLALAALGREPSRLDGSPRLRQRPVQNLAQALRTLGARVETTPGDGGLPATAGGVTVTGGALRMAAGRSSQFVSALLLIGARLPRGLALEVEPPVVSQPYVELTAAVLREFGVAVDRPEPLRWRVAPCDYRGREYRVEGDHSASSYFLAAPAIATGRTRVTGIAPRSVQPDARLGSLLERMGCRVSRGPDWIEVQGGGKLRSLDQQMTDSPDLVPTVAVLGMFAEGATVLRGLAHLRDKESDRLALVARNLRRLGCDAREVGDRLEIHGGERNLRGSRIETASDHRIAMAFAVAGLVLPGIVIDDPACVSKSNPGFWDQFERLYRGS